MGTRAFTEWPAAGDRMSRRWVGVLLAGCLLAVMTAPSVAHDPIQEPLSHFPKTDIQVDVGGRSYVFTVWVASTPARHEQGLMYVKSLPANKGMLFLFDTPQIASFWMKNTLISLDLLFIAPDGRVIRIAEKATPLSLEPIGSMGVTLGVLELAGGTSDALGIKPGARVHHPAFATH